MDHPLANSPGRLPSPPLSPDEVDLEQSATSGDHFDAAYRSHGFLASALSTGDGERDPLLLKSKIQTEEHITALRHRKTGKKELAKHYE